MKRKSGRRSFLKNLGAGGTAAALFPGLLVEASSLPAGVSDSPGTDTAAPRAFNGTYSGAYLSRVAFPLGGMGAGMVCLEGSGALSHVSIRNRPDVFNEPGFFAAIWLKGIDHAAKLLEGPVPDWKKFGMREAANGSGGATTGLPHFEQAVMKTRFPFSQISLRDRDLPLAVEITGWSPFIPGQEDLSSLPLAALEYSFTNTGSQNLEAVFSFNAKNFLREDHGRNSIQPFEGGFILSELGPAEKPALAQMLFFLDEPDVRIDHCWFRGGWWDPLTMAWNRVKSGEMTVQAPVAADAPGASLYLPFRLGPGKKKTLRLMMAWYAPDSLESYGEPGPLKADCDPASGCCNSPSEIGLDKYDRDFSGKYYKPWYSSRFSSLQELGKFWKDQVGELRHQSDLFAQAFYASSLPPEVMEAVAANLSILKSPTVMRQYDGRLWSFEGCGDSWGCCHGSCTHVWNYAQAMAHLFPALERSLRATEFCENQDRQGHQTFRANLPISPAKHDFHAAADGQLGGIMKVYREWRICGDREWLRKIFPMVRSSMDFSIRTWDPRHQGMIEEPHHNTYDIEFWGPDGMHTSFYIGALQACAAMGRYLGQEVSLYESLAGKGRKALEGPLYDGEYFIQDIRFQGLDAKDPSKELSYGGEYSEEARKLLQAEGPKYQYGKGCLSDGVLGAWIARMCGLEDPADPAKIRSHLLSVHRYNLKTSLREHANPQRPSYALGDEGGLLLCSWPKGGKLSLPFVYSDEVWTGIEHQVASHLMLMGRVHEGLEIVRISRRRYDGRIRNPFDEYECGHWYARALSSYGYLQALTGLRYDAVDQTLYIDSRIGDFTCFLSWEGGFGTVSLKGNQPSLKVYQGQLQPKNVLVAGKKRELV